MNQMLPIKQKLILALMAAIIMKWDGFIYTIM